MTLLLGRLATLAGAVLLALSALAGPVRAADLPEPTGEVILTVSDASGEHVTRFDRAMLEALPQTTVVTTTDWTDGVRTFTGPLGRDVLAAAGVSGTTIDAGAINDYHIGFPASDFADWDVLLAMTMDGEALSVRDKGPIWIVYPRDDNPELANPEVNSRWVWQLQSLTVE